jgi:hypothetical protein
LLPKRTFLKFKIYKTIILRVVLDGCETWSLILREDHVFRVPEIRLLRRMSGPRRPEEQVAGENYVM